MTINVEESHGRYLVTKGHYRIHLTEADAAELTSILAEKLGTPRATTPAKARIMRYPIKTKDIT